MTDIKRIKLSSRAIEEFNDVLRSNPEIDDDLEIKEGNVFYISSSKTEFNKTNSSYSYLLKAVKKKKKQAGIGFSIQVDLKFNEKGEPIILTKLVPKAEQVALDLYESDGKTKTIKKINCFSAKIGKIITSSNSMIPNEATLISETGRVGKLKLKPVCYRYTDLGANYKESKRMTFCTFEREYPHKRNSKEFYKSYLLIHVFNNSYEENDRYRITINNKYRYNDNTLFLRGAWGEINSKCSRVAVTEPIKLDANYEQFAKSISTIHDYMVSKYSKYARTCESEYIPRQENYKKLKKSICCRKGVK